jgi:hypothetical protein
LPSGVCRRPGGRPSFDVDSIVGILNEGCRSKRWRRGSRC